MKRIIALSILINIFFAACDCSYQYNVYVSNNSSEDLQISFFSKNDRFLSTEGSLLLKPGERHHFITRKDINVAEGCSGILPVHAKFVAEFIRAVDTAGKECYLKWGDP